MHIIINTLHTLFPIKHVTVLEICYHVSFTDEATEHLNHYNYCHQHPLYKYVLSHHFQC